MARTTTMIPTLTMLLCSSAGTTAEAAELYLSNAWNDQDPAEIYEVELSGTSADLTYLLDAPFPRAQLALTDDGSYLYAHENVFDSGSPNCTPVPQCTQSEHIGQMSRFNLTTNAWEHLGHMFDTTRPAGHQELRRAGQSVIAGDTLYIGGGDNWLHAVDMSALTPAAAGCSTTDSCWDSPIDVSDRTYLVDSGGAVLDVSGGDMVIHEDGSILLWTNGGSDKGLYCVNPTDWNLGGPTEAIKLHDGGWLPHSGVGMAAGPDGDVVLSVHEYDPGTGSVSEFVVLEPDDRDNPCDPSACSTGDCWSWAQTYTAASPAGYETHAGDLASRRSFDYCDFTGWTMESTTYDYQAHGYAHDHRGVWEPYPNLTGSSTPGHQDLDCAIWQTQSNMPGYPATPSSDKTSDPTWFISPDDHINVEITGKMMVDDSGGSNGAIMGIVVGYREPIASCPVGASDTTCTLDFILFDWRRDTGTKGVTHASHYSGDLEVARSSDAAPPLVDFYDGRASHGQMEVWLKKTNDKTWGWRQEYDFSLVYTEDEILFTVTNGGLVYTQQIDRASVVYPHAQFQPGRVGVYTHRQTYATFWDVKVTPLP